MLLGGDQEPICPCGIENTPFHAESCRTRQRGTATRHDTIRGVLARAMRVAYPSRTIKEEPPFDSRDPTGHRADISVLGPPGETFYDLTVVSVHASSVKARPPLQVLDEAAKAKIAKYRAHGKDFFPLVLSVGGLCELKTAKFYRDLQKNYVGSNFLDGQLSTLLTRYRTRPYLLLN
ncbi:hypothetical protein P152DRAFT_485893 [Eremomyces bilateralis CBS 781.70]|uniref:Uncharacterized protein n=1 Tax=Eremomyces bilateralis CBS 781.70 TaxID=1392243 RepID=A0A6G1FQA9_9PEZI|nr:uncharacterized protein P152DRAFT_485893 [Eremomyces bilateralis CBS 781.70]KAF1807890.1 hypothetical protein P152DRAFT_485893 [Eremomyces bilateralis CBS 781.70]